MLRIAYHPRVMKNAKLPRIWRYAAAFFIAYLCFLLLIILKTFKSFSKRAMEVKQIMMIS